MNIFILIRSFPPVTTSAARLYSQLAESLAEIGLEVTVITEHPGEDDILLDKDRQYRAKSTQHLRGVKILRVPTLAFLSRIPGGKPLRFFISCLLFSLRGIFAARPDIILVYSPPIYMGVSGYILSILRQSQYVFNLQDIHPKVLFDTGVVRNSLFKKMLLKMEQLSYDKARSFIVYSPGNRDYLRQHKVWREISIIPNWVDVPAVLPADRMDLFGSEEQIRDRFIISYAGSIQQAQGLEVVVEAAERLGSCETIVFMIAGEGSSKRPLHRLITDKGVRNLFLFPVMQKERYFQFISASDVCLVTLSSDVPKHTVPGKLPEIMACGKPIIAVVNGQGDAAAIVRQSRCGLCVEPGDASGLAQAVLRLYEDEGMRKKMGANGQQFAVAHFSRSACVKRFEEVLQKSSKTDHEKSTDRLKRCERQ